jgi:hypothetical protein
MYCPTWLFLVSFMANEEQVERLKQGVETWNKWRHENRECAIDLSDAQFKNADLAGVYFPGTLRPDNNHIEANLQGIDLTHSNLTGATFNVTNLTRANLLHANCTGAHLISTNLRRPGQITASPSCPEIANGGYSECERRFSYSSGCP